MKKTTLRITAVCLAVLTLLTALTALQVFAAQEDVTVTAAETDAGEAVGTTIPPKTEPAVAATVPAVAPMPKVGAVTGLKKTTLNLTDIQLVWNAVSGADGYILYRCSVEYDRGKFKLLADVKTNAYHDTRLVQASAYQYKVAAYVWHNGVRVMGKAMQLNTATQPPRVEGLTRARSSDVVTLTWKPVSRATGYKILRSSPETGDQEVLYQLISNKNITQFDDTNVKQGTIYTYNVVAIRTVYPGVTVHSSGNRMSCMAGLSAPNFTVKSELYRGFLSWKKNPYATRYNVYYSKDPDATAYTKAGSTTGTSFMTDKLPGNSTLYFRVYPIYEKNGRLVTGTSHTKSVDVSGYMFGKKPGKTYIEVNLSLQTMWYYKDGKLLVETPVVTGMKGSADTPTGFYSVYQRAKDTYLYGDDYVSHVDYWMAFLGGYGIHDASWRSTYGGNIYTYDGSHGCVNTPFNAVKTIYENSGIGTFVIVYDQP